MNNKEIYIENHDTWLKHLMHYATLTSQGVLGHSQGLVCNDLVSLVVAIINSPVFPQRFDMWHAEMKADRKQIDYQQQTNRGLLDS